MGDDLQKLKKSIEAIKRVIIKPGEKVPPPPPPPVKK